MGSSVRIDNKNKYILIPGKGPKQVLDGTKMTDDKQYFTNFSDQLNKFCLSLHIKAENILRDKSGRIMFV